VYDGCVLEDALRMFDSVHFGKRKDKAIKFARVDEDQILKYENIAAGLAQTGFAVIDHFLNVEENDDIVGSREFIDDIKQFKKAGTGRSKNINEGIRGDFIQWIDRATASDEVKVYLTRLEELRLYLNRSLFLSLKDFEVHTTVYPAGSFYKRHLDQFKASDHRKLSVICYLNKDWVEEEGGQLRMFLDEGVKDVFPVAGRLVCFRSDQIEHEVVPAIRERLSLTGWMLDVAADLTHL
jgi:SM-20-related protein